MRGTPIRFHISWLLWAALLFFPYSEAKHLFAGQFKKPPQCVGGPSDCAHTASASLPSPSRTPALSSTQLFEGFFTGQIYSAGVPKETDSGLPLPTSSSPACQSRAPPGIQNIYA